MAKKKLECEVPSAISQVYSTSLENQGNLTKDNPLYAVQRIYETADRWKKERQFINTKLIENTLKFKPIINKDRSQKRGELSRFLQSENHDSLSQSAIKKPTLS